MTLNVRLLLAFFAIYIVWGSTYLAIRLAVETIPPLATAGIRHLCAGLILFVWVRGLKAGITATEWRASLVGPHRQTGSRNDSSGPSVQNASIGCSCSMRVTLSAC